MHRFLLLSLTVLLTSLSSTAMADHWPQFRGPRGDATAIDAFPMEWDISKNVRWKIPMEGEGWSAPVIWGDRVFLTAAVMTKKPTGRSEPSDSPRPGGRRRRGRGYRNNLGTAEFRWEVICLNAATGEQIWKQVTREGKPPQGRHLQNTYASETPVTDGRHVYAYFGMNGLYCFDMDGNPVWQTDPGNYEMRNDWGTSSSPLLHNGLLYLQIDCQEQSFLAAWDTKTGDQVWRADRDEPSHYSSPVLWQNSVREEIVTAGRSARAYDPKTGDLLWELDLTGGRSSATPLAVGDRLYIGSEVRNRGGDDDGGGWMFAVNAGAEGRIAPDDSSLIAWSLPGSGIQMASPVLCAGHLYVFERRRGVLHCINADTGEMAYETRVTGARAFWSSPWVFEDRVFCLDDDGTTHVIQGGPEYEVIHRNKLGEQVWATPAVANGMVFVRTTESLYCIGL